MSYIFAALVLFQLVVISVLYAKLILWKMEHDLVEWLSFGTAMDIFNAREQRKEYNHYVESTSSEYINDPQYPARLVIEKIRADLRSSKVFLPVYFKLLSLKLRGAKF